MNALCEAPAIEIDLSPPYRRTVLASALTGRLSRLAEEMQDDTPAADHMAHEGVGPILDPFLDRFGVMADIIKALDVLANPGSSALALPDLLTAADLAHDIGQVVLLLHESIDSAPNDALERRVGALRAAREYLAELGGGDSQ